MTLRTAWLALLAATGLVLAFAVATVPNQADGTPMYAQRSGRTCANCHVSPTLEDEE